MKKTKDINEHEILSNSIYSNKFNVKNSSFIAVLHFTITVGSSILYVNIYKRKKLVCFWIESLKIKPEITIKNICNMKPARPWMLAHLKIIWQFHAHPVHQKVSRFLGPRYIGDDFFLGQNLVSFNRAVVPYEISKVNFRVETKILVSMSEEI